MDCRRARCHLGSKNGDNRCAKSNENFVLKSSIFIFTTKTGNMKINIALFSVAFLAFAAMYGCGKSGGAGVTFGMSANVGTNTYTANNCIATPVGTWLL